MKKALVLKPEYYEEFSCKGSGCQQTCCSSWEITLSKDEYRRLKHLTQDNESSGSQTYFSLMPQPMRSNELYARINLDPNQKCPFLEGGLCGLQCRFGKEALSDVCNWFPRRLFENYGLCCAALSPGCEKVLEMLPTDRSLIFSVEEEYLGEHFPKSIPMQQIYPKANYPYVAYFQDIYSMCILILQAQDVSLEDRIILLGIGLEKVIRLGEEGEWNSIPAYIENYLSALSGMDDISALIPSFSPNLSAVFNNFLMADRSSREEGDSYREIMGHVKDCLQISYKTDGSVAEVSALPFFDYEKKKEKFTQTMGDRPYFMENLILSIFTYKNFPFAGGEIGGLWDNYIYLCWIYSSLKFVFTVCHEDISSHEGLVSLCVPLLRRWVHSSDLAKIFIENFKENSSDTLAHMTVLVKSC